MSSQLPLLANTNHGEQPAVMLQERLLARRDDPLTSKRAARKVARRESDSLRIFLFLLCAYGPMTCLEASRRYCEPPSHEHWNAEFNKRVKAWSVAGHIELTGEIRDGGRVWRVTDRTL